jgi:hypothetical protein
VILAIFGGYSYPPQGLIILKNVALPLVDGTVIDTVAPVAITVFE